MPENLHPIFDFGHFRGVGVDPLKLSEDFPIVWVDDGGGALKKGEGLQSHCMWLAGSDDLGRRISSEFEGFQTLKERLPKASLPGRRKTSRF